MAARRRARLRLVPPDRIEEDVDDAVLAAAEALADALMEAFERYVAAHPDLPPKAMTMGITAFHAEFLVEVGRRVVPDARQTLYRGQVRGLREALEVFDARWTADA